MSKQAWIFDEVEKHQKKKELPKVGLEVVTKIGNKLLDKQKIVVMILLMLVLVKAKLLRIVPRK